MTITDEEYNELKTYKDMYIARSSVEKKAGSTYRKYQKDRWILGFIKKNSRAIYNAAEEAYKRHERETVG